jgi:hypothetical protein
MGHDLGAIDEDVPFDWEGASALIASFESMANDIERQKADRMAAARTALEHWRGKHAGAFVQRCGVGDRDASDLFVALRDAAEDVRALQRAARAEQSRREAARAWVEAYERNERNESAWNKFTDWWSGEDYEAPPMPPPPAPEPNLAPTAAPVSQRV